MNYMRLVALLTGIAFPMLTCNNLVAQVGSQCLSAKGGRASVDATGGLVASVQVVNTCREPVRVVIVTHANATDGAGSAWSTANKRQDISGITAFNCSPNCFKHQRFLDEMAASGTLLAPAAPVTVSFRFERSSAKTTEYGTHLTVTATAHIHGGGAQWIGAPVGAANIPLESPRPSSRPSNRPVR